MTNIIVVFPKLEDAKSIRNILVRNGLSVTAVYNCGAQVLNAVNDLNDGVVVCGYRFRDMMYSDLHENLPPNFELLLVTSRTHLQEAQGMGIMSISMPLRAVDLVETVNMIADVIVRKRRKRKAQPTRRSDSEKRLIMDAKELLMERNHITESEAHRYIQKCSMDTGNSLVETARMILTIMN